MKKTKNLLAIVAMMLLVAMLSVAGTFAWLTSVTDPVENTFTAGDVEIKLTETTTQYKVVPGVDIAKDPVVTFTADSEKCWLFVKVTETNWHSGLTYDIADGWTELEGATNLQTGETVYFKQLDAADAQKDDTHYVLAGKDGMTTGYVAVNGEVLTSTEMEKIEAAAPKLTFKAYAIQQEGFSTALLAWNEVSK